MAPCSLESSKWRRKYAKVAAEYRQLHNEKNEQYTNFENQIKQLEKKLAHFKERAAEETCKLQNKIIYLDLKLQEKVKLIHNFSINRSNAFKGNDIRRVVKLCNNFKNMDDMLKVCHVDIVSAYHRARQLEQECSNCQSRLQQKVEELEAKIKALEHDKVNTDFIIKQQDHMIVVLKGRNMLDKDKKLLKKEGKESDKESLLSSFPPTPESCTSDSNEDSNIQKTSFTSPDSFDSKLHNKTSNNFVYKKTKDYEDLKKNEVNIELISNKDGLEQMQNSDVEFNLYKTPKIINEVTTKPRVEIKIQETASTVENETDCSELIEDLILNEDITSTIAKNFGKKSSESVTKEIVKNKFGSTERSNRVIVEVGNLSKNSEWSKWLEDLQLIKDKESTVINEVDMVFEAETYGVMNTTSSSDKNTVSESNLEPETIVNNTMITDPRYSKTDGSVHSADIMETSGIEKDRPINKTAYEDKMCQENNAFNVIVGSPGMSPNPNEVDEICRFFDYTIIDGFVEETIPEITHYVIGNACDENNHGNSKVLNHPEKQETSSQCTLEQSRTSEYNVELNSYFTPENDCFKHDVSRNHIDRVTPGHLEGQIKNAVDYSKPADNSSKSVFSPTFKSENEVRRDIGNEFDPEKHDVFIISPRRIDTVAAGCTEIKNHTFLPYNTQNILADWEAVNDCSTNESEGSRQNNVTQLGEQNSAVAVKIQDLCDSNISINALSLGDIKHNGNILREAEEMPLDLTVTYTLSKENTFREEISTFNDTDKSLDFSSPLALKSLSISETNNISPDTTTISPTSLSNSKKSSLSPSATQLQNSMYSKQVQELRVSVNKLHDLNLGQISVSKAQHAEAESETNESLQYHYKKVPKEYSVVSSTSQSKEKNAQLSQRSPESQKHYNMREVLRSPNFHICSYVSTCQKKKTRPKASLSSIKRRKCYRKNKLSNLDKNKTRDLQESLTSPKINSFISQVSQRSPESQKHYNMRVITTLPKYCDAKKRSSSNMKSSKPYRRGQAKQSGKIFNMRKKPIAKKASTRQATKTSSSEVSCNPIGIQKLLYSTREERGLLPVEGPGEMQGPLPVSELLTISIPSTIISVDQYDGSIYEQLLVPCGPANEFRKQPVPSVSEVENSGQHILQPFQNTLAECSQSSPLVKQDESKLLEDIANVTLGTDSLLHLSDIAECSSSSNKYKTQDIDSKPFDETLDRLTLGTSGCQRIHKYSRKLKMRNKCITKKEGRSPYSLRRRSTGLSDTLLVNTKNTDVQKVSLDKKHTTVSGLSLSESIDLKNPEPSKDVSTIEESALFAPNDFAFKLFNYTQYVETEYTKLDKKVMSHITTPVALPLSSSDDLGDDSQGPTKCRTSWSSFNCSSSSVDEGYKSLSCDGNTNSVSKNNTLDNTEDITDLLDDDCSLVMDIDEAEKQIIEDSFMPNTDDLQSFRTEGSELSYFTSCSISHDIPELQTKKLAGKGEINVLSDQFQTERFSKTPNIPLLEPMPKAMYKYEEDLPKTNVDFSLPENRVLPSHIPVEKPLCQIESSVYDDPSVAPEEVKPTPYLQNEGYKPQFYIECEQSLHPNSVSSKEAQEKQPEVGGNLFGFPKMKVERALKDFVPKGEKVETKENILRTAFQKFNNDLIEYGKRNVTEGRKPIIQTAPDDHVQQVTEILEPIVCGGMKDMVTVVQTAEKLTPYSCCAIFKGLISVLEKEVKNVESNNCEAKKKSQWITDIDCVLISPNRKPLPLNPRIIGFVGLLTLLNDKKKRLKSETNFLVEALCYLETAFLRLNNESNINKHSGSLMFLGFVYVSLARLTQALDQIRRLLYDLLYCYTKTSYTLAYTFLKGWPAILNVGPVKCCGDPIALAMINALTTLPEPSKFVPDNLPKKARKRFLSRGPEPRLTRLHQLLRRLYKFNSESVNADQLFEWLCSQLCQPGVLEAIILLSKRRGVDWSMKNSVQQMIELVQQWKSDKTSDVTAIAALNTIGCVARSFNPGINQYDVQPVFRLFEEVLFDENTPDWMQETVVLNICRLSRLNFHKCTELIVSWKPSQVSSSVIDKILLDILAKQSHLWRTENKIGMCYLNKR